MIYGRAARRNGPPVPGTQGRWQLLALPAGQPHAVKTATPFKMLLVMIRA
jgi:hypothetical protein